MQRDVDRIGIGKGTPPLVGWHPRECSCAAPRPHIKRGACSLGRPCLHPVHQAHGRLRSSWLRGLGMACSGLRHAKWRHLAAHLQCRLGGNDGLFIVELPRWPQYTELFSSCALAASWGVALPTVLRRHTGRSHSCACLHGPPCAVQCKLFGPPSDVCTCTAGAPLSREFTAF